MKNDSINLIEIKNLKKIYNDEPSFLNIKKEAHLVLNNINLNIQKGQIVALVGESGCGKSTLANCILKLINPTQGEILYKGEDILKYDKKQTFNYRKKIQMIFQNPYSSLDPKMKIFDTLKEPLKINTDFDENEIEKIIYKTIEKTGLDRECLKLYPHEFSGGQRQRIAIARALVLNPEFILADEPVSALDVSIQAQIINLLKELKEDYNLTFLFISHDMSVIKYIADRVAIMYLGEIIELGKTDEIFFAPEHPYTKALLSSVPQITGNTEEKIVLEGDLPSPADLPAGCKFHTRCPYCMPVCREKIPPQSRITDSHFVKCFLHQSML